MPLVASCKHGLQDKDPTRSEDGASSAQKATYHDRTEQHDLQFLVFQPCQGVSAGVTGNTQKYFHSLRSVVFTVSPMLTELASSEAWLFALTQKG